MLRIEIPGPLLQEGDELVGLPGVALPAVSFGVMSDAPVDRPLFGGDPLFIEAPNGPGLPRDVVDERLKSLVPDRAELGPGRRRIRGRLAAPRHRVVADHAVAWSRAVARRRIAHGVLARSVSSSPKRWASSPTGTDRATGVP